MNITQKRTVFRVWLVAALLSPLAANAWQSLAMEPGRRVEYDVNTLIKEGSKATVSTRMLIDVPLEDLRSASKYQIIEATMRYDCEKKSAQVIKRTLRKANNEVVREEPENTRRAESVVRPGTVDERVMKEVCRPDVKGMTPEEAKKLAEKKAKETPAGKSKALDGLPADQQKDLKSKAEKAAEAIHAANQLIGSRSYAANGRKKAVKKAPEPPPPHWEYEGPHGPEAWGDLEPANKLCKVGLRQSPIDIRDGMKVDLEPIGFHYSPALFKFVNNGHTLQASMEGNRISLTGKTYEFLQIHFHHPAEEKINGRGFPMVAHLVHKSAEGDLAVVAVLLEEGRANHTVQTMWNYIPLERQKPVSPPDVMVDLNGLIPENKTYYTYYGSLTTPPCTEGVLWLVLKTPITLSAEQIAHFRRLYPHNARPIQATGDRLIKESR